MTISTNLLAEPDDNPLLNPFKCVDVTVAPKIIGNFEPGEYSHSSATGKNWCYLGPIPSNTGIDTIDELLLPLIWIDPTKHLVAMLSSKLLLRSFLEATHIGQIGLSMLIVEMGAYEIADFPSILAADRMQQSLCRQSRHGRTARIIWTDPYRPTAFDMPHVILLPLCTPTGRQAHMRALSVRALRRISVMTAYHTSARAFERLRLDNRGPETDVNDALLSETALADYKNYLTAVVGTGTVYRIASPLGDTNNTVLVKLTLLSFPHLYTQRIHLPRGILVRQAYVWLLSSLITEAHDCVLTYESSGLSALGTGRSLSGICGIIDFFQDTVFPYAVNVACKHIPWRYHTESQFDISKTELGFPTDNSWSLRLTPPPSCHAEKQFFT